MNILNVGPLELLLIVLVALVVLGPKDIVNYSQRFGKWIYHLVQSPIWRSMVSTSQELRELPKKIIRDAGIEESLSELNKISLEVSKSAAYVNNSMPSEGQTNFLKDDAIISKASAQTRIEEENPE